MAVAKDEIDLSNKLDNLKKEERFYENQIEKINNELSKLQSEEVNLLICTLSLKIILILSKSF